MDEGGSERQIPERTSVGVVGAAFATAGLLTPIVVVYSARVVAVILAFLTMSLLALRFWRADFLTRPPALLLWSGAALVAWSFLSAIWAVDGAAALITSAKVSLLWAAAVFIAIAASSLSEAERHRTGFMLTVGVVSALAAIALEWLADGVLLRVLRVVHPSNSVRGYWFDKPASALALLVWPAFLWLWQNRWQWAAAVLAVAAVVTLKQLQNVTASYGLLGSLAFFAVVRSWPRKAAYAAAIALVTGTVTAPLIASSLQAVNDLEIAGSRFAPQYSSLSARLTIWDFANDRIAERPVIGWGMDSSRSVPGGTQHLPGTTVDRMPLHPHNVFLQWWLELGFVGALLAAILGASIVVATARAAPSRDAGAACLSLLALAAAIWMMSYGAWQSWWLATLALSAAFMAAVMPAPAPVAALATPTVSVAAVAAPFLPSRKLAVVLAIAAIIVGLGVAEAAFRWLPGPYSQWFDHQRRDRTTVSYREVGDGLFTLAPTHAARMETPCTDIEPIRINAQGFRDRPWSLDKQGFRIAVLGDDFAEGLGVGEGEHVSAMLSDLLGVEVMNAGIGDASTAFQLATYERFVAPYRPDLVLLLASAGSDVAENSCDLSPRALCGVVEGGEVAYRSSDGKATRQAAEDRGLLHRHLALYRPIEDVKTMIQGMLRQVRGFVPERFRLYLSDQSPEWRDAWTITEDALARLKLAVEANSARLAVAVIPEHFVTSMDWERELILAGLTAVPDGFDPLQPTRQFEAIARRLGLPVVDLAQPFLHYRDVVNLRPPYFAYSCDGHWNPVAHFLASYIIADFLAREDLLPSSMLTSPDAGKLLESVLKHTPQQILGTSAFLQIYGGGRYAGGAAFTGAGEIRMRSPTPARTGKDESPR